MAENIVKVEAPDTVSAEEKIVPASIQRIQRRRRTEENQFFNSVDMKFLAPNEMEAIVHRKNSADIYYGDL